MPQEEVKRLLLKGYTLLEAGKFHAAKEHFAHVAEMYPGDYRCYRCQLLADCAMPSFTALLSSGQPFGDNPYYQKMLQCAPPHMQVKLEQYHNIRPSQDHSTELRQTALVLCLTIAGGIFLLFMLFSWAIWSIFH